VRGLLFAAAERGVYVSYDDGESWQSLTLNLPRTSVRDLIVHADDLAIATHGRGFWILDDMTPLRRVKALAASPRTFLFPPRTTYRVRRDQNTDTPLPPEVPAARNPPDGAIVDYYLADDARGPVTLEIFGSGAGGMQTLVRRYSSDDTPSPYDEKAINVPMYWARPLRTLSAAKGAHRFVWDLRYPAPGAITRDFPISAIYRDTPLEPLGVLARPGSYIVKLTANGQTLTQPLTLKIDPRAAITPLGLQQQFALATRIATMMNATFEANRAKPSADLVALNADLATAYDVVEGADRAPTSQAVRAVATLEQRVRKLVP
jgi:hypothetical protein